MSEQRPMVEEWRCDSSTELLMIRFWIEADPTHGGLEMEDEAWKAVNEATAGLISGMTPREAARYLLELIPAANSIEVRPMRGGAGLAIHRDWP